MNAIKSTPGSAGFTLIEIMVVVVILGILAAIVAPNIIGRVEQARVTRARTDIQTIEAALKMYRIDNSRYPSTEQGLEALVQKPAGANLPKYTPDGYLERLRKDPWSSPYQYLYPGQHGRLDIYSFGADGLPGGSDNDADIGNWNLDE
ncbi:MAG: type II secretion system major pseudopilin GspG [Proteobacteria bacterium]|nr:type II secretion system major pseudopilin GspG [Pseudomonadota bacterium]MCH7893352.1 type II secretion system major pseudopilin GspG [Pseudomonadota bacterium]